MTSDIVTVSVKSLKISPGKKIETIKIEKEKRFTKNRTECDFVSYRVHIDCKYKHKLVVLFSVREDDNDDIFIDTSRCRTIVNEKIDREIILIYPSTSRTSSV